jgi:uncharacterized membrane protein
MDAHLHEWLHLFLRWAHIVAAIMWIGDSFLFMWLDRTLRPPVPARDGVTGETYMVHGGGYYQVEKRMFQPGQMPPVLHWFKWESASTWLTGISLLLVVFYLGGEAMLVDTSAPHHLSGGAAMALGLALLPACWLVYDAIWASPLGRSTPLASGICLALFTALAFGVTRVYSGRAAYMHLGAVLGTIMVANVWVRILPPQNRMLARVRASQPVDPAPGLAAKKRSTHNTYLTLPVVFIMVSNHFPTTYGSRWNWGVVVALGLAGAAVRHFMLVRTKRVAWLLGFAVAIFAAVAFVTSRE